jgi:hypothetical protein
MYASVIQFHFRRLINVFHSKRLELQLPINPVRTEINELYLNIKFIGRSQDFLSLLEKPVR